MRSRWLWLAFPLIVVSIALSVTRLALACLAIEAIVLVGVFRRRAAVGACSIALVAVAAALFVYPNYGPVVSFDLTDVRPPAGAHLLGLDKVPEPGTSFPVPTPSSALGDISGDIVRRIVTADDASIQAHFAAVRDGAEFVVLHPLGLGLGASMPRLGAATGPGESAVFQIGGEVGLVGLLLFLVLYGGVILAGAHVVWRRRADPSEAVLAVAVAVGGLALAPVVLTGRLFRNILVLVARRRLHRGVAQPVWGQRRLGAPRSPRSRHAGPAFLTHRGTRPFHRGPVPLQAGGQPPALPASDSTFAARGDGACEGYGQEPRIVLRRQTK